MSVSLDCNADWMRPRGYDRPPPIPTVISPVISLTVVIFCCGLHGNKTRLVRAALTVILCFQRQQNRFLWNKKSNSQSLFLEPNDFLAFKFCQIKEHFDRLLVRFEYMTLPNPPNHIISRIYKRIRKGTQNKIKE